MNTNLKPNKMVGFLLFAAGILLSVLLVGGLIWSDVEAVFYGLPHLTSDTFNGLYCPPLMTRSETANLRVTVRNETDRPIAPLIRVDISAPGVLSSSREKAPVMEPGQSATLEWPVSEENIDLNFFIFAKAFRYPDYRTRLAEDTCGILVLNVPFINGSTLLAIWLGLSILSTLAGLWILDKHDTIVVHRANMLAGFRTVAIAVFIGVFMGLQGAWFPGIAVLVFIVLLIIVLSYFSFVH